MKLVTVCFVAITATVVHAGNLAVTGDRVYTMAGAPLEPGIVLIEDGRIERVGDPGTIAVPDGYERMHATIVTPGLIDARTVVGLAGAFNVTADQDQDEKTGSNQLALRVADGYNPAEPLVAWVNRHGVTTMQVGPGRANVMAGQAIIVKTHGNRLEDVLVRSPSSVMINLGQTVKQTYAEQNQEPRTRMATARIVRSAFIDARNYRDRLAAANSNEPVERNLAHESLLPVLRGEIPVTIMAHRADDIATALRLAREFDIQLVIDSGTEGYLMREALRASGAPVLVHPALQRIMSQETLNTSLESAALLNEAGIPIAFQSSVENYVPKTRVLLFEAAIAHGAGLDFDATLGALTSSPARILGIAERVGSLEEGKDADLVLFDGNPFEFTSHVTAVIVGGAVSHRR